MLTRLEDIIDRQRLVPAGPEGLEAWAQVLARGYGGLVRWRLRKKRIDGRASEELEGRWVGLHRSPAAAAPQAGWRGSARQDVRRGRSPEDPGPVAQGDLSVLRPTAAAPPVPKVAEYADPWLKSLTKPRPATVEAYRLRLTVHMLPLIGQLRLTDLTRERVRTLIAELMAGGNRRASGDADGRRRALAPGAPSRACSTSSRECWNVPSRTAGSTVLCLARSGVRLGEAVALEWRDVDFDRRVLLIRRSERRGRVSQPKSGEARRVEMSRQRARVLRGPEELPGSRGRPGRPGCPGPGIPAPRDRDPDP
jgi:hypothetical protein